MIHVDKDDFSNVDSSSLSYSFKRMSAGMKVLGNYGNQAALLDKVFENLHCIECLGNIQVGYWFSQQNIV